MLEGVVLLFAFLAVATLVWFSGLWGGFLSLFNLILAALFATAFFEPIADQIEYGAGQTSMEFTYVCDFAAIWVVFVGAAVLARSLTDSFSGVKLKFDFVTELVGRSLVALLAGAVFVCFTHFTLLVAPVQPSSSLSSTNMMAPHQIWMGLTKGLSQGSLAESSESPLAQPYRSEHRLIQGDLDIRAFDPQGIFQAKYAERRQRFSQQEVTRVSR
jgi:hypothetical protein